MVVEEAELPPGCDSLEQLPSRHEAKEASHGQNSLEPQRS